MIAELRDFRLEYKLIGSSTVFTIVPTHLKHQTPSSNHPQWLLVHQRPLRALLAFTTGHVARRTAKEIVWISQVAVVVGFLFLVGALWARISK